MAFLVSFIFTMIIRIILALSIWQLFVVLDKYFRMNSYIKKRIVVTGTEPGISADNLMELSYEIDGEVVRGKMDPKVAPNIEMIRNEILEKSEFEIFLNHENKYMFCIPDYTRKNLIIRIILMIVPAVLAFVLFWINTL